MTGAVRPGAVTERTAMIATLHHYLTLIRFKTYADLKSEAQRTLLGFLWWIIEPVMFMTVFYIVFGLLLRRGTEDFVPFLLVGLVVWQWTRSSVSHCGMSILGGRPLMQQVHLPKAIFPIIVLLTDTIKFAFAFSLLLLLLWVLGYPPSATYLALPALLLTQFALIAALGLLNAAVVPFLPDLRFVVDNLFQAAFFLSGIFYRADVIPPQYRTYYYLNPMANLIEDYRNVLMYQRWPDWQALALIVLLALFGAAAAALLIRRYEYVYPRITN